MPHPTSTPRRRGKRRTPALLSIHDVTPAHLPRVLEITDLLHAHGSPPTLLLLVPGLDWTPGAIDRIRALVARGYELAGHGWAHQAPSPRTLHHRLHAALISRDQAEHLSRGRSELRGLVTRCHAWFGSVNLPWPDVYVPPAWALGALRPEDLADLPFTWYESLRGFTAPRLGVHKPLPLMGFEADTATRRAGLTAWNRLNQGLARVFERPVRIAIHPDDLHLHLGGQLRGVVAGHRFDFLSTDDWLAAQIPSGIDADLTPTPG